MEECFDVFNTLCLEELNNRDGLLQTQYFQNKYDGDGFYYFSRSLINFSVDIFC